MPKKQANGNSHGPQIPRREVWVDLPEEYPGFQVKAWVNAPSKVWESIRGPAADVQTRMAALKQIMVEHNGWLDYDGNEYPQPSEDDFWYAIPDELLLVAVAAVQNKARDLPNSLRPTRRR